VYGAYGYDVSSRIEGITDWSIGTVQANRYDASWTFDGFVYDIQNRVNCGDYQKGNWTSVGTATAHPQTAPGPNNVFVTSTTSGVSVSFDPPTGPYTDTITEYNLIFFDYDQPCSYLGGAAFQSSPVHLDGLVPGHHYLIAFATYNAAGGGFPEIVHDVVIGGGIPAIPSNLQVISNDPTTVHVTWDKPQNAAGYTIFIQNINDVNSHGNGTGGANCADDYFLFPGTWNYEFAISAFNGNAQSAMSGWVPAPYPVDGATAVTCPPPPPYCPQAGAASTGVNGGSSSEGPATSSALGGSVSSNPNVFTETITGSDGQPTPYTETFGLSLSTL